MEDELLLEEARSSIRALESLISDFRAGKITEFIGIGIDPDSRYRLVGSTTISRHRAAGMLLELAVERLGYIHKDD